MPEEWIIRVKDREYGPVDLQGLRQWKEEGRVLPSNQARRTETDAWIDAWQIPGLFDSSSPSDGATLEQPTSHRTLSEILSQTFRIYGNGFFQFLLLTLLVIVPSVCAQLTGTVLETSSVVDANVRTLVAGAFAFCMLLVSLALWPIYVAGIQLLTAEIDAGRPVGFSFILNQAARFWPRVAGLCVFVYGSYLFWTILPIGVILMIASVGRSLGAIFVALLLLAFQVWIVGRLFINFMFWQQFAVLGGTDAGETLRGSKALARSRQDLTWYKRPLWRGVFISSLWFAFVLALNVPQIWSAFRVYFHELGVSQDVGNLIQALAANSKGQGSSVLSFTLGLVQALLRPLLGIAFVLLYLDSTRSPSEGSSPSDEEQRN